MTVCFPWSFSRTRAKMYSFQLVMNAKTDVATRPGRDERQQDPDERAEPGVAVDHRRLLELPRDADDEAAQRPDRERQRERQVGDDHAGQRVRPGGSGRARRRAG